MFSIFCKEVIIRDSLMSISNACLVWEQLNLGISIIEEWTKVAKYHCFVKNVLKMTRRSKLYKIVSFQLFMKQVWDTNKKRLAYHQYFVELGIIIQKIYFRKSWLYHIIWNLVTDLNQCKKLKHIVDVVSGQGKI